MQPSKRLKAIDNFKNFCWKSALLICDSLFISKMSWISLRPSRRRSGGITSRSAKAAGSTTACKWIRPVWSGLGTSAKAGRSTSTGGGSPSIASFGKSRSVMAKSSTTDTLRRIGQPLVFITDWNHATRRLFKETDGMFRCTLPDRTTQIRVATFYEFLTTLFGQRQIGAFLNYEVKIKGNGQ